MSFLDKLRTPLPSSVVEEPVVESTLEPVVEAEDITIDEPEVGEELFEDDFEKPESL